VLGVDDVLHADRHAVQRAARRRHAVERARLHQRVVGIDGGPGVQGRLARRDAVEAIANHCLGGEFFCGDALGDF
jgi:hypothetical protein